MRKIDSRVERMIVLVSFMRVRFDNILQYFGTLVRR